MPCNPATQFHTCGSVEGWLCAALFTCPHAACHQFPGSQDRCREPCFNNCGSRLSRLWPDSPPREIQMPNVSNEMPRHPFYLQRWFTEPASGSPHHHLVFDTAIDSPTVNGPSKHITRRMSEVPAIAYNAVYRSPPASGTQMCVFTCVWCPRD